MKSTKRDSKIMLSDTKAIPNHKLSDLDDLGFESPRNTTEELVTFICRQVTFKSDFKTVHRTTFYIILLVLNGEIKIVVNNKEYSLEKNSLIILRPNDLRRIVSFEGSCVSSALFSTDSLIKTKIINAFELLSSNSTLVFQEDDDKVSYLNSLLEQVHFRNKTIAQHCYGKELLYATLQTLLYEVMGLIRNTLTTKPALSVRRTSLTARFLKLAEEEFREKKQVIDYAKKLHVHAKHLTKVVEEVTGKKPTSIIKDLIIYESMVLMDNTKLDISEIAYGLGFGDPSSFGKFFKRHAGLTPRDYRLNSSYLK